MIGQNKILINGPTMRVIVQHYFNTVLFKEGHAPTVEHVAQQQTEFAVHTAEPEQQAGARK